jgi:SAM-dependent methyltransferase
VTSSNIRPVDAALTGGFDAEHVRHLRAAEDRHFWFGARNAVIAVLARQIDAGLSPGYRALEVGCGTGNTLQVLVAACRRGVLIGMDFQREGLALARDRVRSPLVQADVCRAPFSPSVKFALIGMFDVLEHIDDDRRVLAAAREWLAPGGALFLTVPAAPELWSAFDVAARHCRRYTRDQLQDKLQEAGFSVEYVSPFMSILYPVTWLRRRVMARWAGKGAGNPVTADLRVVPGLNEAMAFALRYECRLIHARRQLPLGTSLVAIAR